VAVNLSGQAQAWRAPDGRRQRLAPWRWVIRAH
jgi:hypothetical protein